MVKQAKLKLDLVKKPVDHTDYRIMIGSLMYVISSTPYILFATCMYARYQANPNEHHVSAVKRIFHYLKRTINLGLWYPKDSGFDLTAYSDADHARCHLDRKCISGSVQVLGDKLVCWSSKKQNCVFISTAKSEYLAVSSCCAQVLWMRTQLTNYGFFYDKVPIYCDSKSAIAIACNPVQHTRTKHIDVRYHFIKDHVEKGTIELYFVGTEYQLADLFTKSLPEARFRYHMLDPQSDSANRKLKHVVGSPKNKRPNEMDLLDDEKLRPFREKIMSSVFGKVKGLSRKDESSESDEDAETTPVANKNFKEDKFWNMPPLLKTPVLDIKKKGTPGESFSELPLYCHNLKLKNQGTITHIETNDEDRFEIFFLAVDTVICTFVLHMRPLIIIDGAHLKGEFLSTIYLSVAMDGNNQILPLAYGVGKSETFRSWDCNGTLNIDKQQTSVWRALNNEVIFDVGHPSEWDQPDGLITVLPPIMDKRQPRRPRNHDRFRSKGQQIKPKSFTRCFKGGHNRRDCPSMVPSQIFIPTTSSVKSGFSWNEEI
nr:retrovirus-related Pol polyprotein from transposon TNT 1-94 [Tanacetum cinerariifolium]